MCAAFAAAHSDLTSGPPDRQVNPITGSILCICAYTTHANACARAEHSSLNACPLPIPRGWRMHIMTEPKARRCVLCEFMLASARRVFALCNSEGGWSSSGDLCFRTPAPPVLCVWRVNIRRRQKVGGGGGWARWGFCGGEMWWWLLLTIVCSFA